MFRAVGSMRIGVLNPEDPLPYYSGPEDYLTPGVELTFSGPVVTRPTVTEGGGFAYDHVTGNLFITSSTRDPVAEALVVTRFHRISIKTSGITLLDPWDTPYGWIPGLSGSRRIAPDLSPHPFTSFVWNDRFYALGGDSTVAEANARDGSRVSAEDIDMHITSNNRIIEYLGDTFLTCGGGNFITDYYGDTTDDTVVGSGMSMYRSDGLQLWNFPRNSIQACGMSDDNTVAYGIVPDTKFGRHVTDNNTIYKVNAATGDLIEEVSIDPPIFNGEHFIGATHEVVTRAADTERGRIEELYVRLVGTKLTPAQFTYDAEGFKETEIRKVLEYEIEIQRPSESFMAADTWEMRVGDTTYYLRSLEIQEIPR